MYSLRTITRYQNSYENHSTLSPPKYDQKLSSGPPVPDLPHQTPPTLLHTFNFASIRCELCESVTVGATFMPWNFRTCIWVQTLHQWNLQYGQVQLISHTITGYHLPKARCTIFLAFVMHTKRTAFTSYSCNKLQNLQYHIVCLSKNHKISECNASA